MQFLPIMIALATSLVGALDSSDSSDEHHPFCKPKVPDFSQVPACAVPCIVGSSVASTPCADIPPDYKCWCTPVNFAAIIKAGTDCTVASCGEVVANTVALPAFQQFCCEVNARGTIW